MIALSDIHAGMSVVGADGHPVGRVRSVEGATRLLLEDTPADGNTHYLPTSHIVKITDQVHLDCPAATARTLFDQDLPAGENTT
ncbi:MAG: DUF2171 domain-containing protein [Gluconacetobacter sp.]|uniref:DUF2171 domain-containing protein n=1 Tax=Gluconacetobacter dulcium TaxID=2729096 RepID=A0A7W4JXX9_9PROT|nr:DUF2171 domain-containing protein [Gluconacetobacter dulcium]MBB2196788.1 DUF2171 domain-containing protein [Gluconacetobacter dulcium]